MGQRFWWVCVAAFWLLMNVLLWRTEYGLSAGSSSIPLEGVVERMLEAADPSTLRVMYRGERLGTVRWMPTVLEDPAPAFADRLGEGPPEGMVTSRRGYRLEVDFTRQADLPVDRWRALLQMDLSTSRDLEQLSFRWHQRPILLEVDADMSAGRVKARLLDGDQVRMERVVDPGDRTVLTLLPLLMRGFGGGMDAAPGWKMLEEALPKGGITEEKLREPVRVEDWMRWVATQDRIRIGRHPVRAYRLRGRILGSQEVEMTISRAGEILQARMGDITMVNSEIPGL